MTSRARFAVLTTGTVVAGVLTAGIAPTASAAGIPITITPNPAYASAPFEGWGTSLVWFANATGGYPADVRQDLLDKVFGDEGLNLNIARYNIGGGNATDVPPYLRPGGAVEGWWNPDLGVSDASGPVSSTYADRDRYAAVWDGDDPTHFDFDADRTQRWWIDAIKDRITRWEAFSNSPPYFLTESGYVSGGISDGNIEQLATTDMAAFSDYLVTVVERLEAEHGIDFDSLDPFNEPNTNYWSTRLGADGWPTTASRQEGAHIGPARQDAMITALAARLAEPGTTTDVPISAMDETNPGIFATNWNAWSAEAKAAVERLNVHTYGTGGRRIARDIAKSSGKPLWMSEVEGDWDGTGFNQVNIENGLGMAGRIVDDLRELEPSAWVLWQPVEDLYNMQHVEDLNWGSVFIDFDCNADGDSLRRIAAGQADPSCRVLTNAKYNTLRNFTHYIRPGDSLIPTDSAQTTAAVPASGEGVTLVHVNTDSSQRDLTIDLSKFGAIAPGATVTPIVTTQSPAADPEQNALVAEAAVAVDAATRSATVSVPAKSVTTLLVTGVSGVSGEAAALRDGHSYQLFGVHSGKALDADAGALVIRSGATAPPAATAQTWTVRTIEGEGTDRHRFSLQAGDGRFLSASGGATGLVTSTAEAAASDPALQWISSTTDGKTFSLLSVAAERVLDVSGQGTADGTAVGLWTSNGGGNQRWTLADTRLVSVRPVTAATPTGTPAALPAEVTLVYDGGVERTAAVTWNPGGIDWSTPGTRTITGAGTDLFGAGFEATATVEVGALLSTEPVSLTTYAGVTLAHVQGAAPETVPAVVGATDSTVAVPVTWDWDSVGDASFASPGVVTVSGTATTTDAAHPTLPATLSVVVTETGELNVAPDSTAAATFTESSSYGVDRTKNHVTTDKGWSNWLSGTKRAQDTLTYTLAERSAMQHVKVYFYKDGTSNSWAQSLTVEYLGSAGAWISTGTVDVPIPADGTAPTVDVPLGGVEADAVRVVLDAYPSTHLVVSEVELYAAAPSTSTVADLASITLDGEPLAGFSPDDTDYAVDWPTPEWPAIRAVAVDRDATVEVSQAGVDGVASVVVTAPSGAARTYTVTFHEGTPPVLDAAVTTSIRCVAGKAVLAVTVRNTGEVAAAATVVTTFGRKTFASLQPGAAASAAFSSRVAAFAPGDVEVELAATEAAATRTVTASHPAGSCG